MMKLDCFKLLQISFSVLVILGLSGCNSILPSQPTPIPPTETPLPPTATPISTNTPIPTTTPTEIPTATATLPPTIPPPSPTPAPPTSTPKAENAVLLYYFKLDQKGRWGCREAMYWVNTGVARSDNTANDIAFALRRLFSYHGEYFGTLYNPYNGSNFAVGDVQYSPTGITYVYITGDYVRSKDPCDPVRIRDQIKQTILELLTIKKVKILINGAPISDALSRK